MNLINPPPTRASLKMECSDGCHQWVVILAKDFAEVPATGEGAGVVETGIRCPECGKFYRAAFDSDGLKALRKEVQSARGRLRTLLAAKYVKQFDLFQALMKRKTGPHPVESPIH